MPKIIEIPNVGEVEFPDSMSETDINAAASKLYTDSLSSTSQQPTYEGGIPLDIYQEVNAPQLEGILPPPEPTPAQQAEQEMMSGIRTGEQFVKSLGRGAAGAAIALGELSPAFPEGTQPVKEALTLAIPPLKPLFEHKSEGWVEHIAEFAGGFLAPEGAILASKVPTAKALTKKALTESHVRSVQDATFKQAAKAAMGEFEPLDLWTPKLQTVENKTLAPLLANELQDTVAQQAAFEKQLVESEAAISKQTGRLIERELAAKERAAARIDKLSQESATATSNKEGLIARAQEKLAVFNDTIEDPTVFNDRISSLEARRLESQARIQALDQEMTMLDQTADIDKLARLEGQKLSELSRRDAIVGEFNEVTISRGMSRDQRLLARQQLQGQTEAAIQAANLAERKAQGQLSKEAAAISKGLQEERIRLLRQLQQKRGMRQDLNETANKLRENLLKQEQIKQTMRRSQIAIEPNLNWSRTFGATNIPEMVHARALEQVRLVDDMLKAGFVKPELADSIRNAVYTEVLATNGIKTATQKLHKFNILNETFRWGNIQKRTGVPTNESVQKTIWALNEGKNIQNQYRKAASEPIRALHKSGIGLDDQTKILQYFEKMEDGSVVFKPEAYTLEVDGVKKVVIPEYRGPVLTESQQAAFRQLREIFDDMAFEAGVSRLPRYVPLRELPQYAGLSTKTSAEVIQNATLAQARTSGQLVSGIHETNIINLVDRYTRELARKKFIAPALEDSIETLNMLHLSGLTHESVEFKKWLLDAFNIDAEKTASQVLGTYKLNQIKPLIDDFVRMLPDAEGATKQIYDALSQAMFVKLVGINPKTWVKQFLQFPTLGSIELGERWVASGLADATNVWTVAGRDRIREAKKILRASLIKNSAVLESELGKAPTNKIAKAIDLFNAPSRAISRRTMEAGEEFNRLQSVLAAQNKFSHYWERAGAQGIQRLLDESALTTAQKQMISRSYLSGGVNNARDVYSLLMTQRINFAYGLADSPRVLRSEFGRLFPFLTYTRNVLTRGAEAIAEGKPKDLAKLVLKPLMLLAAFAGGTKLATGTARTLPPGSGPAEAVMDIYKYGVTSAPQIILKNAYNIISPIPFSVWDEKKFKKELDKKLEVFPEVGKSSPLYDTLLKGFK